VSINGATVNSAEGTAITLTSAVSGTGTLAYAWGVTKNGSSFAAGSGPTLTFTPDDNGTYVVSLAVTNTGGTATDSKTINVTNVAPTVLGLPTLVSIGTGTTITTSFTATFTDPGTKDTHTCTLSWDDGSSASAGVVTETNGSGSCKGTHTYTHTGVFTVTATVTDKDGGSASDGDFLVVYDPTAGYVSGSGFVNSPAGAYTAIPSATGKASFGFNTRYQLGSTLPSGPTTFNFTCTPANLKFSGVVYEWLVVTAPVAQFKGSGTINGAGNYGFIVTAVDGQQAIEKAAQFLPDIILLDMMMPEKDGLQACREIRGRTSTQSIPIILLTARADEETKLAALEAGASDFLSKPFSTTELHVRIRNLVESHQYQMKLAKQNTVLENAIEQLKETETQLVQTEKLASLGRMSAGIIHEINNPLNFATTGLFTLRNKAKYLSPEQQEEYREILKDVEEGIKRVKNIVSDLRSFSHPGNEGLDQVEVAEIVTSALRFLSGECKDKVQIEQDIQEHQTIWANKNKLIQVLVNLVQNSVDAMKGKTFDNEKPTIRIEGRVENGLSLLRVRDNGTGIDSQHLDKIFDPFYTTKDVGEGMGLGLSICYRIVQECDGRIAVKTEPGKYCEFTLEFPAKGKE